MAKRWFVLFAAVAFLGLPAGAHARATCREVRLPVSLAPGEPANEHVGGRLCRPARSGGALQILIPGASYDARYWDFGIRPQQYSYVRAMGDAGQATLALDPLGRRLSSWPPADRLTFDANVDALHQVVQAARQGRLSSRRPRQVFLVGHSLGAAMALVEAARYRDVDALVVSGYMPHALPAGAPEVLTAFMPAQLDERLAGRPPGYLTTRPGARHIFYNEAGAREDVIAHDEATKDALGLLESSGLLEAADPRVDRNIIVPVLLAVGERDELFCSGSCRSQAEAERQHYANAPGFDVFVLPRSGHSMNLHEGARTWFEVSAGWLASR